MNQRRNSKLMWYISIALIIFVITAFGIVSMVQPDRLDRYIKPFVIIHIVSALGWLFLFSYQSKLILQGQRARHQRNQKLGVILVSITTIFSILITYQWGLAQRVVGESRDVLVFASLFFASIWVARKGKFEAHKRLMLIASLNLVNPAITRVKFIFDLSDQFMALIPVLVWIVVPIGYDIITIRKIHKATMVGIFFTLVSFALMIAIVLSPWMDTIETILYPQK